MNLKKEEEFLKDPKINVEKKIPILVTIWLSLKELIRQSKPANKAIDWAQRHTLNVILQGDWAHLPVNLKNILFKVVDDVDKTLKQNQNLTTSCKKLINIMSEPWGSSMLNKILTDSSQCSDEELIDFFSNESGYIVAMRLNKLCKDNCGDLAFKLAKSALDCLRLPNSQSFHYVITEEQKLYILDVYIALGYKFGKTQLILNELKLLNMLDGLQLVNRFTKKRVEICKIWRHGAKIAELAANYYMTAAMTQSIEDCRAYLADFLKTLIICNNTLGGISELPKTIRKIMQAADSSAHIYTCIEVLNEHYGERIKSFTTELYVRALTTDMNELEKQKQVSNMQKVDETSKRLAKGFLSLADVWEDHYKVSRECVLTSFSLNPTQACMERIEKYALSTYKNEQTNIQHVLLNGCNVIPDAGTSEHISIFTNSELHKVLTPYVLGLSEQLCDDLVVVLSGPRYQFLSWVLTWPELKAECESYLNNTEGKNVVKELKYLRIDYNQFKDWPEIEDDSSGIEKGYEMDEETESEYDSDCSTKIKKKRRRKRKMR